MKAFSALRRAIANSDPSLTDRMLDVVSLKLVFYAAIQIPFVPFIPEWWWPSCWFHLPLCPLRLFLSVSLFMFSVVILKRQFWGMLAALCFVFAMALEYYAPLELLPHGVSVLFVAAAFSTLPFRRRVWSVLGAFCFVIAMALSGFGLYHRYRHDYFPFALVGPTGLFVLTVATLGIGLLRFTREVKDGRRPSQI